MNDQELYEKVKEQEKKSLFSGGIPPLVIHISILLLLVLIIYFFFISDFSIAEDEEISSLVLIGDVVNFSKDYSGNMEIYSAYYSLKTRNGEFDGENIDMSISNFSGIIYVVNESLVFEGTSPEVRFGKNKLNLRNEQFSLKSTGKTTFDVDLEYLNLKFNEGRIKFAEELNNDFKNSSISIKKYNTTITYDGTFSFNGGAESFDLTNPDRNLRILYNIENVQE
jgi:hypothetical protein